MFGSPDIFSIHAINALRLHFLGKQQWDPSKAWNKMIIMFIKSMGNGNVQTEVVHFYKVQDNMNINVSNISTTI